jgi:hypothetical protein
MNNECMTVHSVENMWCVRTFFFVVGFLSSIFIVHVAHTSPSQLLRARRLHDDTMGLFYEFA